MQSTFCCFAHSKSWEKVKLVFCYITNYWVKRGTESVRTNSWDFSQGKEYQKVYVNAKIHCKSMARGNHEAWITVS